MRRCVSAAPSCVNAHGALCSSQRPARRTGEERGETACASRGKTMTQHKVVRAIYHEGTLQLLEPVDRAIQFSSLIPMRSRANVGWAAKRRQAAAIFV